MNIIVYQYQGGTCRFIYELSEEKAVYVVSCENYSGMEVFLRYSSTKIENDVNIYDLAKQMNKERRLEREISAYESTL